MRTVKSMRPVAGMMGFAAFFILNGCQAEPSQGASEIAAKQENIESASQSVAATQTSPISASDQTSINGMSRTVIEKAVADRLVLPQDAGPIQSYSRYFAPTKAGTVQVVYIQHEEGAREAGERWCQEEGSSGDQRCKMPGYGITGAGQSLWFSDTEKLPELDDGGCALISMTFNPKTKQLSDLRCNEPWSGIV